MGTALLELLEALEDIGHKDESLFNSSVRQAMGDAVFEGLALMMPDFVTPASFGIATPEANRQAQVVIQRYLDATRRLAAEQGLTTFHQRLAAIQNRAVKTNEQRDFEDYLGYTNPEFFDQDGRVTRMM
jgi:hypothetical protein